MVDTFIDCQLKVFSLNYNLINTITITLYKPNELVYKDQTMRHQEGDKQDSERTKVIQQNKEGFSSVLKPKQSKDHEGSNMNLSNSQDEEESRERSIIESNGETPKADDSSLRVPESRIRRNGFGAPYGAPLITTVLVVLLEITTFGLFIVPYLQKMLSTQLFVIILAIWVSLYLINLVLVFATMLKDPTDPKVYEYRKDQSIVTNKYCDYCASYTELKAKH